MFTKILITIIFILSIYIGYTFYTKNQVLTKLNSTISNLSNQNILYQTQIKDLENDKNNLKNEQTKLINNLKESNIKLTNLDNKLKEVKIPIIPKNLYEASEILNSIGYPNSILTCQ